MPSDTPAHEHDGKPCSHTHSNEFCEPCDSGYRTWVCMFQGDTPKDSNEREERRKVADIMSDAHNSGHWSCTEEDCHQTTGSPINQIIALIEAAERAARIDELDRVQRIVETNAMHRDSAASPSLQTTIIAWCTDRKRLAALRKQGGGDDK